MSWRPCRASAAGTRVGRSSCGGCAIWLSLHRSAGILKGLTGFVQTSLVRDVKTSWEPPLLPPASFSSLRGTPISVVLLGRDIVYRSPSGCGGGGFRVPTVSADATGHGSNVGIRPSPGMCFQWTPFVSNLPGLPVHSAPTCPHSNGAGALCTHRTNVSSSSEDTCPIGFGPRPMTSFNLDDPL